MSDISQLRWLCRRGMRELDIALTRYLENHYANADESHQHAFKTLLNQQDPDLYALLLGRECSDDPTISALVKTLATHQ